MATLVLGAVGSALGGPLGGAIGTMVGQSLDQGFFASGQRGPRLSDLAVQTSSYGAFVPRLYGTIRVAGSVIWATDIRETALQNGGYAYSASFAVAVSARQAKQVRRVWADGRLVRGADGQFKVQTGFRFHLGTEDQQVDPLIASIEGVASTPAYRGFAVAVFEDLQLAEFGNRIPSLTFEVEADGTPPSLGQILSHASDEAIQSDDPTLVQGFAVQGAELSQALMPLLDFYDVRLTERSGVFWQKRAAPPIEVGNEELGCSHDDRASARRERQMAAEDECPRRISMRFHDPLRDYQSGEKHASTDSHGRRTIHVEMPIVMEASVAKARTEDYLARCWSEREQLIVRLPPSYLQLEPGDLVQVAGDQALWRADKCTVDGFVVAVQLKKAAQSLEGGLPADAGRSIRQVDESALPTSLIVLDLPSSVAPPEPRAVLHLAAAGGSSLWRPVPIDANVGARRLPCRAPTNAPYLAVP